MGNTIKGILASIFETKEATLVIMGLDAAGKTSLLYRVKTNEIVTTIPTIGFNVELVTVNNVNLTVWDLGGQDKVRSLWHHYFQSMQGLIYVLDANDRDRLEKSKKEFYKIFKHDRMKDKEEIPVLIYANKQDLPNAMSDEDVIKAFKLDESPSETEKEKLPQIKNWFVQKSVFTDGDGIQEGLKWLCDEIK